MDGIHRVTAILSVTLSACTTLIAFGLLAFSATPFIRSIGLTLLCAITLSWLFALLGLHDGRTRFMVDVLIIGAGPAGSMSAALLAAKGYEVLVLEKQRFPRFSIGESLLANTAELLNEAGMLDAVMACGFQYKNGAAFVHDERYSEFNFADKFSAG